MAGGPEDVEPGGGSPLFAAFAGTLGAFLYSVLDLEMFPSPLIDQLQAAQCSGALLAHSIFLHFLYKEPGRRGAESRGDLGQC